ncbi:MAG: glycoside hydrolase family 88 protein [Sandaracinaceae bacterium]|nr:glycoside hydrolase family 88 protein [Sandaracinaceae bacterium]
MRAHLACVLGWSACAVLGCGGSPSPSGADGSTPTPDAQVALDGGTPPAPYYDTTRWGPRFADMILETWPDARDISAGSGFQYNNGIVLHGIERIYEKTGDPRYLAYIRAFVDAYVGADGSIPLPAEHDVDRIEPAILLPFLYEETGDARYLTASRNFRGAYDAFPLNSEGGYWHKERYPNEMWLDSIYMTGPFLTRYGSVSDCGAFCFDTPAFQAMLLASHAQSATTGLLVHGWDGDRNASWADPATGLAPIAWDRATGWYAMALVDMLDDLPQTHPSRAEVLRVLRALAEGIRDTQDPETGLWHQVIDQGARADNWIETSGSAILIYAIKKAVDRGYIPGGFLDVAVRGWEGLKAVIESATGTGSPRSDGAVQGMGIQNDYANYVNKPRLTNSSHGLCGVLMAASQMERYEP